jgi:hypothetical protein
MAGEMAEAPRRLLRAANPIPALNKNYASNRTSLERAALNGGKHTVRATVSQGINAERLQRI